MIWSYWEGPKPDFIDVCIRSMKAAYRDDFTLVTPETLQNYIEPRAIDKNFENLHLLLGKNQHMLSGLRADCIRAALLAEHGGWWFDADTIGLKHPEDVKKALPKAKALYMTWSNPDKPRRILNGYIYLHREVAVEWLKQINFQLKNDFEKTRWCALGEGILTPMLSKSVTAVEVPRKLFLPLDDIEVETFFKPGDPLARVTDETICFGMNHSYMVYHHGEVMKKPWNSDLLIHRLLRFAETLV